MILKNKLIEQAELVFEKGNSISINYWRLEVIEYLIHELANNPNLTELRNFYLYFEGQKDSVNGDEYNRLGQELRDLFLLVGDKPNIEIISKAKSLKNSIVVKK